MKNKTTLLKKEECSMKWFLFDAKGKTLGRFASEIAKVLRGKHKTDFTPHMDSGDGVIVINASKVFISGDKEANKVYHRYTGYVAGHRETPYRVMMKKKPEFIIMHAVKGMMPKSKLARHQIKKLRIFKDDTHNMQSQKPIELTR
jgi:large subunit ribosomal protein L13